MEHKSQYYNSKAAEAGVLDPSPEYGDMSGMGQTIKRDLRRRHINMIALAGMIVRFHHLRPNLGSCLH